MEKAKLLALKAMFAKIADRLDRTGFARLDEAEWVEWRELANWVRANASLDSSEMAELRDLLAEVEADAEQLENYFLALLLWPASTRDS